MSLSSLSQTVTKTALHQNNDSLICLPKKFVGYIVRDLIRSDANKMQVGILNDILDKMQTQDNLITQYKYKVNIYESLVENYKMTDEINQNLIQDLTIKNKRYKKQRNILKISLGVSLIYIAATSIW